MQGKAKPSHVQPRLAKSLPLRAVSSSVLLSSEDANHHVHSTVASHLGHYPNRVSQTPVLLRVRHPNPAHFPSCKPTRGLVELHQRSDPSSKSQDSSSFTADTVCVESLARKSIHP